MSKPSKKPAPCDRCDGPNDRAAFANWCSKCAEEYNRRVAANRAEMQKQSDDYWRNRPY